MLAPFATLIFLVSLWLIARIVFEMVGESGGRIAAALRGAAFKTETRIAPMRVRVSRPRPLAPVRAAQRWRAAA